MKIRIRENSIRFRITRTELDIFAKKGLLENKTEFGFADFVYAMQALEGIEELAATYIGNKITVFVPAKMKSEWATTDIVGFSNNMNTGNGRTLSLLIEKDWACIDNTSGEDQADNFKNPNTVC